MGICHPDHIAYVIYTSGSTGQPKGVEVTHRAAVSVFHAWDQVYTLAGRRYLQAASWSFDVAVGDLVRTLGSGATLVLVAEEDRLDASVLCRRMLDARVDSVEMVPALARHLLRHAEASGLSLGFLDLAVLGGDVAAPGDFEGLAAHGVRAFNSYGVTEAAIDSSYMCFSASYRDAVPIGRPFANTDFHVLDRAFVPVPIGTVGELVLGGPGLARGYARRPGPTAARFVPNPFSRSGSRLYRTGDLVRYLVDGDVDFLGRADHQVKVRGYRVEVEEIETVLARHPSVSDCAVVARCDGNDGSSLAAVVVLVGQAVPASRESAGTACPTRTLREHLDEALPAYMIPSAFVFADRLPLTPNGKVDRGELRRRRLPEATGPSETRRSGELESLVCGIFADVLGKDEAAPDDDFFALGGHSLNAMQAVARVREASSWELELRELFQRPTARRLAARLSPRLYAEAPLVRTASGTPAPISSAQERMLGPVDARFNLPVAFRLRGELDLAALSRTLREVVRRHETLRTAIRADNGCAVQVVRAATRQRLRVVDLAGLAEGLRAPEERRVASREVRRPFDLAAGALLRACLLRLGTREHVLIITFHHVAIDGWSIGILSREVRDLYRAYMAGERSPLPPPALTYSDFARWERRGRESVERSLSWWREQLAGVPALDLPARRPRCLERTARGAVVRFSLVAELTSALRRLARRHDVTLFMVLLAAFQRLLGRRSGQDDFCVTSPVSGRPDPALESVVGLFIDAVALRADLSGDPSFTELLSRVRETVISALSHQEAPYHRVWQAVAEADPTRPPLTQAHFELGNMPWVALELPGLVIEPVPIDTGTAKYELFMDLVETDGALAGSLEFSTDLFDRSTALGLVEDYRELLEEITG